jgi:hypothetical protein
METGNHNFQELLLAWIEHMLLNGAAQIEETALYSWNLVI